MEQANSASIDKDREIEKLEEELRIVKSERDLLKNLIVKMAIDKYGY